jgi:hypothetical protein
MSQFVIILNDIQGVDLIMKALAYQYTEKNCLASSDLHDGIIKTLHMLDNDTLYPIQNPPDPAFKAEPEAPKKFPKLKLV